jgi:hypothetical protein
MRRICSFEVFGTVFVVGVLAALVLPPTCGGHIRGQVRCAHNLAELYRLASTGGDAAALVTSGGWRSLTHTTPMLIAPEEQEVLICPLRKDSEPGDCDYRCSRVPFSKLGPSDPVAADRPGNHGNGMSINVLFKDGSVMEVDLDDPRWKRWNELLGP